jgi:vesicle coat complex subunit
VGCRHHHRPDPSSAQVYERIKAPLLTLIASACPEIAFAVVGHLRLLVRRAPVLFATSHKSFFCRFSDPPYIKQLKLEMLTAVADSNNVYEVRAPGRVVGLLARWT